MGEAGGPLEGGVSVGESVMEGRGGFVGVVTFGSPRESGGMYTFPSCRRKNTLQSRITLIART